MKFINFYMKLLYLYIVIVIFQYFLFVINEILYKFVIDEKKNEMAADLYNKFKSSHEGLSDNETKSLMKKLSLLKISIVTVIFIYIVSTFFFIFFFIFFFCFVFVIIWLLYIYINILLYDMINIFNTKLLIIYRKKKKKKKKKKI